MRAITHITVSTFAAAAVRAGVGTFPAAGLLLFGGFLDIDHLGLFISSGLPSTPSSIIKSIFRNEEQIETAYSFRRRNPESWTFPVLHSLELVLLLFSAGLLMRCDFLVWGGVGVLLHLVMDMRSYPCGIRFFFLTWRGFNRNRLMKRWDAHRSRISW